MEASRTFEHEKYEDGSFQSLEETEVSLQVESEHAELDIDHEIRPSDETERTLVTLSIKQISLRDLRKICDQLGDWCGGQQDTALEFETGFIDGTWSHDGHHEPFERLQFTVDTEGITITTYDHSTTVGEVRVPPRVRTNGVPSAYPIHIHSFKSFLQTALSCTQNYTEDNWPRLDGAGEFTGPLDQDLADASVAQYHEGDHVQAIAAGAQELERILKDQFPEYADDTAANLMAQIFSSDNPSLQLSTDGDQQQGIQFLFQGLVKAYRNTLTHVRPRPDSDEFPNEITRRHARDVLYLLDLLYLLVDEEEPQ